MYATKSTIQIDIKVNISKLSISKFLEKLESKHALVLDVSRKHLLLSGLKELSVNEPDFKSFFSPDCIDIVEKANFIEEQYRMQPKFLEVFRGVLTDLFIDYWRLLGHDARPRLGGFLEDLNQYDAASIIRHFAQ
ncbi:hypothetical protein GEMRC1_004476 [Eukaryota sp. GEM-RC1]